MPLRSITRIKTRSCSIVSIRAAFLRSALSRQTLCKIAQESKVYSKDCGLPELSCTTSPSTVRYDASGRRNASCKVQREVNHGRLIKEVTLREASVIHDSLPERRKSRS